MKKYFKKSIILIIPIILLIVVISYNNKQTINDYKINHILKGKDYAYLPEEAKEYIEKVYDKTGEIVKTEKNKEDSKPYLNPKYVEYLELSDEEKDKVGLIPDAYVLDYEVNKSYSTPTLPSSYDLRNIDGKNYVSSIKNQESTGICWAFASVENIETLLMKQNGQSYSDLTPKFSIRQMDYATSTNRLIKSYVNSATVSCTPVESCNYYTWKNPDNGSRELGKGGNFFTSSIVMANGLTLVDESVLPWNDDDHTYWPKDIFSYENSLYEVNSTIQMPAINEDSASEELLNSYVSDVKNYMIQYGGPFVGTYSPKSTCGFDNTDGTKAMKTDDCVNDKSNKDLGHAMQIIGWDDNYEYSYCDAGTKHYAVKNSSCTSGKLTQGKGAWILRNSWGVESDEGNSYKYFYLTYDSTRLSIGFTTSVSEMANRSWDNNYHSNPWIESNISNGMASVSEQTKEFDTHNNKAEKIEKVKFVTASKNGRFSLSVITEAKEYNNIATVNSNEVGVYTVDLSNKNIILEDNSFSVKIVGENDGKFYNDSISVFTSNTTNEPYVVTYKNNNILSYDNPLKVNLTTNSYENDKFTFTIYQKNLPSNSIVDFKIVKLGEETTSNKNINGYTPKREIYLDKQVFEFEINESYYFSEGKGPYVFQLLVNDNVVDTFPIVRSGTANYINVSYSDVKLHANNGTDYYETINVKNETYHKFDNEDINNSNFFNNYHYIVGWNTKADGTGTSYPVDKNFLIIQDMDLYAQWSSDTVNSVNVDFGCQKDISCYGINGTVESQTVEYNKKIIMPDNNYIRNGYKFSKWRLSSSLGSMDFFEGESSYYTASYYIKYPVYNNLSIRAYAIWIEENNVIEISFDSNGGTGDMKSINVQKALSNGDLVSNKIKENIFSKPDYTFIGWNTKADGTGTSYNDKGKIQSESDVKLYAQWVPSSLEITFDSNDETGKMNNQKVTYNVESKLLPNTFTKEECTFKEWNTKKDGTGTSYKDEDTIKLTEDITLYAQWTSIPSVSYQTHVQDYGWQDYVKNGKMSGTTGEAKRLEGIKIKLNNIEYEGNIEYRTHVEDYGWQEFVKNNEMSGTSGEAKRLEAIEIKITGEISEHYDIYYRVHAQDYGWLGWAKNGEKSGTAGYAKRLEGIEVVLVEKGKEAPGSTKKRFVQPLVSYQTHVEDYGWQNYVRDGQLSGTTGKAKRLEGIRIKLDNTEYEGNIEYRTHVEDYGWQEFVKNNEMSGTSGKAKRLEAIEINLTGEISEHYDVYYKVHAQDYGWLDWAKNGEKSGTAGLAKRLEGIKIVLVEKNEEAPGSTKRPFVQR